MSRMERIVVAAMLGLIVTVGIQAWALRQSWLREDGLVAEVRALMRESPSDARPPAPVRLVDVLKAEDVERLRCSRFWSEEGDSHVTFHSMTPMSDDQYSCIKRCLWAPRPPRMEDYWVTPDFWDAGWPRQEP